MAGGGVDGGATAAARDRAWQPAGRRYSTRTRWIELNRDVIIDLWNQAITPDVAIASCKSCRNRRERDRGSLHHRGRRRAGVARRKYRISTYAIGVGDSADNRARPKPTPAAWLASNRDDPPIPARSHSVSSSSSRREFRSYYVTPTH